MLQEEGWFENKAWKTRNVAGVLVEVEVYKKDKAAAMYVILLYAAEKKSPNHPKVLDIYIYISCAT